MQNKFLIIGMGSVGQQYMNVLKHWDCHVDYIDPSVTLPPEIVASKITFENLNREYNGIIHCGYAFTRYESFLKLKNVKADFHLIEKLCFSSLSDIETFRKPKNTNLDFIQSSSLYTHLRWNVLNIDKLLINPRSIHDEHEDC